MITAPKPSTPPILMPKDEITLAAVAYFKYMTAEQIHRLVYPNAKTYTTATRRLTELADSYDRTAHTFLKDGYLSYVYMHDKAAPQMGHPQRVFFLSTHNLRNIADAYKRRGKHTEYQHTFADVIPIQSQHADGWAHDYMRHELAITDYALALRYGAATSTPVLFWERTSPHAKDIKRTYTVTKPAPRRTHPETDDEHPQHVTKQVHFNPDSVDCVLGETAGTLPMLYLACSEIDRASESLYAEFLPKIYAYDELTKERKTNQHTTYRDLDRLLPHFVTRYHLTAPYPILTSPSRYQMHFRIRIVTTNTSRRNDIIRLIARYSAKPQTYHVTTLDQFTDWQTFYSKPVWYAASDYAPLAKREKTALKHMRPTAFATWLHEQIETHISPVPYFHRARRGQEATP